MSDSHHSNIDLAGKPISEVDYPAITICSQGWINKVLAMSLLKQYRDYAAKKGVKNALGLKFGENHELEGNWVDAAYPGYNSNPMSIGHMYASPDINRVNIKLQLSLNFFSY